MLREVPSFNAEGQTAVRRQPDGLICNSFGGNVPSVAVVATWILMTLWLLALGAPAGVLASRRFGVLAGTRIALWFGLASALLLLLLVNFFVPLRSTWAVAIAFFAAGLAVVAAITIAMTPRFRAGPSITEERGPFPYWSLVVLVALALSTIPIAHAAFGAANQWDSGLYHLNAIQYASEYRVIPGLANLHDRLGLTNSQHLITAVLSNSGWGIDAFRLQVGFFVFLVTIDLSLRIVDNRPAARSVGSLVLLVGGAAAIAFFLSNTDELITSPSPDSVALLLTLVGAAYLADGLSTRRTELAATGVLVLACAGSVRTQLWAFTVIAVILVIVFFRSRASGIRRPKALTLVAALVSGDLLLTTQVRDAIQTGWLLFPLDRFPLPVDWKAFDPAASRLWIISWARTPGAAPDEVMETWTWVGGWLTRATGDWSVRLTLGLLAVAGTLWLFRLHKSTVSRRYSSNPRASMWLLIPVITALTLWFLSAPDPRFAWGQIVLLGAIPAAVAAAVRLASAAVPVAGALAALVLTPAVLAGLVAIDGETREGETVTTFTSVPWTTSAALTPVPMPDLAVYTLPTGEELVTPTADDRCWMAFPLCRPYPNDSLLFRGDSVQDGFSSRMWTQ